MNDLTIGGFVMRNLEEIEKDIDKTRKQLRELYDEQKQALTRDINIDKDKYYMFYDPDDKYIKYIGKVYNYWKTSQGEYQFEVTGIQECLSDIQDGCWAGFDAMYVISVRPENIDNFLDNFSEITKEEFDNKVNDLCRNIKKWISYWLDDE